MKQPNILFVFPDQFSPRAFGYRGEYPVKTPNLDALAQDSLVLENALSNAPLCSPYRAMLMSGNYPHKNGVISCSKDIRNPYGVYLKKNERCISDVLRENGYDVGYIGKWHLDAPDRSQLPYVDGPREADNGICWDTFTIPERRHQINYWHSYGAMDQHMHPHYFTTNAKVSEPIHPEEWSVKHEAGIAIEYIKNEKNERDEEKPFMLFLANNPPHPPFDQVPQEYADIYKDMSLEELLPLPNYRKENPIERSHLKDTKGGEKAEKFVKNYFGAITGLDEQLGRVLDALKEKGIYDDTIIVFTSDHGEMLGSQNLDGKTYHYYESLKVPFLIRYPEKVKNGNADFILNTPDIMPTLLSMVGLGDKIPSTVQGEDKSEFLTGEEPHETAGLYFEYFRNGRGIKTKDYTFVSEKNYVEEEVRTMLYDDKNDPYQLNEISAQNPEIVNKLRAQMIDMLEEIEDNLY